MDPATRASIERAAGQIAQTALSGNAAALQASAMGTLGSNIQPVQAALDEQKPNLPGAQATTRSLFLLDYPSTQAKAEFFCGVYNSADRTGFSINGLPAGKWAIAIEDVRGGKAPLMMTEILGQQGAGWKLAGFYLRSTQLGGHDSQWFLQKARAFKAKGEGHDAWFYYLQAWELTAPVDFMSTQALDTLAGEMQPLRPTDLPSLQRPVELQAGGKTFQLIEVNSIPVGENFDLRVRYKTANISDTAQTFQNNMAVMKALVEKYPEYRDAFVAVIARAVDPSGQDYGTLAEMAKLTAPSNAPARP